MTTIYIKKHSRLLTTNIELHTTAPLSTHFFLLLLYCFLHHCPLFSFFYVFDTVMISFQCTLQYQSKSSATNTETLRCFLNANQAYEVIFVLNWLWLYGIMILVGGMMSLHIFYVICKAGYFLTLKFLEWLQLKVNVSFHFSFQSACISCCCCCS